MQPRPNRLLIGFSRTTAPQPDTTTDDQPRPDKPTQNPNNDPNTSGHNPPWRNTDTNPAQCSETRTHT